ncbi:MAG TPA: hypothetical protein VFW62_13490, partial [bacterium]|nr:hypothetical protein [bacterium]
MKTGLLNAFVERWIGSEERVQRAERARPPAPGPSPLQADLESRKLRGPQELSLIARRPPWKEIFGSFHPSGYYVFALRLPDGLFREEELPELANWIRGLNVYLKRPVVEFSWNRKDCGRYHSSSHRVGLRPEWHVEPSRRTESARATLSHEMMHGLFHSEGLDRDAAWRSIYRLSLADRSYELFDDSNY